MEERLRFVARAREGEAMADLCREFGISRKTGYKIVNRFEKLGPIGLEDQRRAPRRIPHKTPPEQLELVFATREDRPTWGPKKIKAFLERRHEGLLLPTPSTIGYWLKQKGLVRDRRRKRGVVQASGCELTKATAPNEVWCADFKGQFQVGDGRYCYPLTITDLHSRLLIACTALESTKAETAVWAFEEAFEAYGLPKIIRTDNGCPFASTGLAGLTSLSTYWYRVGVRHERTEPGSPQQNGAHERMHLTLKQETTRPAAANVLQQQERFDEFRRVFNEERPHEALGQKPPSTLYVPSERRLLSPVPELSYPLHDLTVYVSTSGSVYLNRACYHLTSALVGERVGLREVEDGRWVVTFASIELGFLNERTKTFEQTT